MTNIETSSIIDITEPERVEVLIRADKKVIWINVDGICRLRCSRIKHLKVNDESNETKVLISSKHKGKEYV